MNNQDAGSPPVPGRLPIYFLIDLACSHAGRIAPALGEIEQILRFARNLYAGSAAKAAPQRVYFSVIGFGSQAFQAFPVCPSRDADKVMALAAIDAFPLSAGSSVPAALALLAQSKSSELHNVGLAGDAHPIVYLFTDQSVGEVIRLLQQQSGPLADCDRIIVIGAQVSVPVDASGLPECEFIAPEQLPTHLECNLKPLIEQHQRDYGTHSFYRPQVCSMPLQDLGRMTPGQENALSEPWAVFLSVTSGTQATIKVVAKVPGVIRWRLNIGGVEGSHEISAGGEVAIPLVVPQEIVDRTLLRGEVALYRANSLVGLVPIIGWVTRAVAVAAAETSDATAVSRKKRMLVAIVVVTMAVLIGSVGKALFFPVRQSGFSLKIVPESPAQSTVTCRMGEILHDRLRFTVKWGRFTADTKLDVKTVRKAWGEGESQSSAKPMTKTRQITLYGSHDSFDVEYLAENARMASTSIDVEGEVTITCPSPSISLDAPPFAFRRHIVSDK